MTEVYKCSLCKDGNLEATLEEHKKHLEEFHKIDPGFSMLGFTYQIYSLNLKDKSNNDLVMKAGKKLGDLTFKGIEKGIGWLDSKPKEKEAKT